MWVQELEKFVNQYIGIWCSVVVKGREDDIEGYIKRVSPHFLYLSCGKHDIGIIDIGEIQAISVDTNGVEGEDEYA